MKAKSFDCIVIGGGHAGIEAAHAAAGLGAQTALVTISKDTIGKMSCNPAIGGLAKGQIAREVDAMGGLMGLATDATAIQFRLLNRSKGPAVRSPRAQADKFAYSRYMQNALEQIPNLTIIEAMATDIRVENNTVCGIGCADGSIYKAPAVIVTTGTFLRGIMHIGNETFEGGRLDEPASNALSDALRRIGLTVERLKTGTPARLDAKTVDFDQCEIQHGDDDPQPFSFMNNRIDCAQVPCWITWTNETIHQLLRDNLQRAPLFSGQIQSTGPRYCPSIETKIIRFADKPRHQVFLEPEQRSVETIYCNGISTSVPRDVQDEMIKLLPGTQRARIVHYAYAIEYDYCPPIQLKQNLECKHIEGLFLAGQINGTSGYEEAAGQGILAGINAVRKLQDESPVILGRDQAYIGVMIDDLLTRGIDEPYRMFTSRAEYRLSLRSDNADRRLTPIAIEISLADADRKKRFEKKIGDIEKLKTYLQQTRRDGQSLWDDLRRPDSKWADKLNEEQFVRNEKFSRDVIEAVTIDAKYEGYLTKQEKLATGLKNLDKKQLPPDLDYRGISHLRAEAKEKLAVFRPQTLGQASRISGITPADITVIQIHLKKHHHENAER